MAHTTPLRIPIEVERIDTGPPPPKVAHGTATKLGIAGAAAAILPVVIAALTDERLAAGDRRLLIIVGAGLAALVVICRSAQAIAAQFAHRGGTVAPLEGDELVPFHLGAGDEVLERLARLEDLRDIDAKHLGELDGALVRLERVAPAAPTVSE